MKVLTNNFRAARLVGAGDSGTVVNRRVRSLLTLLSLVSWIILPGYASSRPAPSASATSESRSVGPRHSVSGFDSIQTTSDSPRPVNVWTSNGPEGGGSALAIDPNNPNTLYAGSGSGVFRSTNGGGSWSAANDGLPDYSVRALAIDPIDPNTIYAAIRGLSDSSGLFKSTDGGVNWSRTYAPAGKSIDTVAIALSNPNIVYVGTSDPPVYRTDAAVSTDRGETWEVRKGPDGIFGESVWSLAIDPKDSKVVYSYIEGDTVNGPCKSTDGGRSWTALFLSECRCVYFVGSFVIDPNSSNVVYLLTAGGVYKSLDGGAGWTNLGLQSSGALAIVPSNSNILYAGTGRGVFKSTDGGVSWNAFNDGLTNLSVSALAVDASGSQLHAGTEAGVFDYYYGDACAVSLAPVTQNFEANGGTGSVDVTAADECAWAATNGASWISITSGRSGTSGSGTVSYSVEPNTSTLPRTGTVVIAARAVTITQAGLPVRITNASVKGKKLFVVGENFDAGAVIQLNGEEEKTIHNDQAGNSLTGKRAGKKIKPGDKLQVKNPNGSLSEEFIFSGM